MKGSQTDHRSNAKLIVKRCEGLFVRPSASVECLGKAIEVEISCILELNRTRPAIRSGRHALRPGFFRGRGSGDEQDRQSYQSGPPHRLLPSKIARSARNPRALENMPQLL